MEIRDVERVEDMTKLTRECELLFIRLFDETCVERRDHDDLAIPQRCDEIAVHRIFVDIK